ncbi:MAG: MFS transporter [Bacteriovorax sp.]|nr:MFS transporter [Bacteriovorax sp.]
MHFPALEHKDYRVYMSGQFISLIGTSMQQLAMSWMIFKLTNSPLWLGIAGFSAQLPMFIFGLFAGVIVDHVDRHKLLIWTQALAALQAFVLAALTFSGKITLTHLIILDFTLGTINAFDMTTRQAFIVQIVKHKKNLPNAIAINSSVINLTRLLGPAIAGMMIAMVGEGMCFLFNGLSYIAVLSALLILKVDPYVPPEFNRHKIISGIKTGYEATFKNPHIRSILIFLIFISFFGMPYTTFFPAIANKVPNGGAHALGWISSCVGVGSLLSALWLSNRQGAPTLARVVGISGMAFAVFLIVLSRLDNFQFILFSVFTTGMSMMLQLASSSTIIQSTVDDDKRGRVMSFFNVSLLGILPFGSLLMGYSAEHLGLHTAFLINGSICLVGAFLFYKKAPKINEYILAKSSV